MKGDSFLNYTFKLNFQDKYYAFYDWFNTDHIQEYNHIKYYKVDTKTLNDLINYVVKMETGSSFVYIFSDTFTYIALIFNNNIAYQISSVMLNDEYKLKKIYRDLKYTKLNYEKLKVREKCEDLRYMEVIKKALLDEVSLLSDNDEDKIKYLYYEWFDKKESNIALIKKKMLNKLQKPITSKEKYIYDLILASKKQRIYYLKLVTLLIVEER